MRRGSWQLPRRGTARKIGSDVDRADQHFPTAGAGLPHRASLWFRAKLSITCTSGRKSAGVSSRIIGREFASGHTIASRCKNPSGTSRTADASARRAGSSCRVVAAETTPDSRTSVENSRQVTCEGTSSQAAAKRLAVSQCGFRRFIPRGADDNARRRLWPGFIGINQMSHSFKTFVPFNPTVTVSLHGAGTFASDALMVPSGESFPVSAARASSSPAGDFLSVRVGNFPERFAPAMSCAP